VNCIVFEIRFLSSKSILEAKKCKGHAVTWKWPPLLVTSLHWSHHVDQKALVTRSSGVAVDFFRENEFLYKIEMILQFHKVDNFLFLCISVHLEVILL